MAIGFSTADAQQQQLATSNDSRPVIRVGSISVRNNFSSAGSFLSGNPQKCFDIIDQVFEITDFANIIFTNVRILASQ